MANNLEIFPITDLDLFSNRNRKWFYMAKFCPGTECDFWGDFPDGFPGKKVKACPYCFQILLEEKPSPNFLEQKERPPFIELHSPGNRDPASEQERKAPISTLPDVHSSLPREYDSASEQGKKLSLPTPSDLHYSSLSGVIEEEKRFDLHSSYSPKLLDRENSNNVTTSGILQLKAKPDRQVTNQSAKDSSHADNRKRGKDEDSHISEPISGSRKSERIEDKYSDKSQPDHQSLNTKFKIYSEIDPSETSYVNIQFTTLILEEYWKKVDAICFRIGHKYFGNFHTSIVLFSRVNTIKLQCGKFVTISGTLKFPSKLITNGKICFPYKYFIYSKDNNESFEQLHHPCCNFDRYFLWDTVKHPKQQLINSTYQQFDMMILPEIRKKEDTVFWSIGNTTISYVGVSGKNDRDIPFYNIADRRLASLQTLLPSYLGLGNSQPCGNLEDFVTHFQKLVNMLMYFYIQPSDCQGRRYWELYEQLHYDNFIKLVETWIMNGFTPDKSSHLDPKTIVSKFYLGCYLMYIYQIKNDDLMIKLINMVEESIEPILKKKFSLFDNTVCVHQPLKLEIRQSVFHFIFNRVMLSKQYDKILLLLPLYHAINNMQEFYIPLHEELEYGDNKYWGFPNDVKIYWQDAISIDTIRKTLNLTKYDQVIPYTVVIYSLNENNVNVIYESFIKDTRHFPLSALMAAILFRIQHTQQRDITRDDKLRTEVMKALTIAFTNDSTKFDVNDINRLTKLTLVLTFILPIQYFNQEQFKLCMTLLSQGFSYCDYHLPDNPIIPFEKMTGFFNNFVYKWYSVKILNQRMFYFDYLDEIKF